MKTGRKKLFLLALSGLGFALPHQVTAQSFTNLYSFMLAPHNTNSDGEYPTAGLVLSSQAMYGTATFGGSSGEGAIFKINIDGTGFTNLHSFAGFYFGEGEVPETGVILAGSALYGTTKYGGSGGSGTVFAINTDGTGFTNLHSFAATHYPSNTNADGALPRAGLILSGGILYGTTYWGGSPGNGAIFAVDVHGMEFTNLHIFTATANSDSATNSDGANPSAGLILSGNALYGTTPSGGTGGSGTLFAIDTNGSGFTNLHNFGSADGAYPNAALVQLRTRLYGTTSGGGDSGDGTVFAINTDGSDFTNLHSFTAETDGAYPGSPLILWGNCMYGMTATGGSNGAGTVFAINLDGSDFTNLYDFMGASGGYPYSGLIESGNALYGTTTEDGSSGRGAVFRLSFGAPQLTISRSGNNVFLTWPTSAPGFILQSVTNLISPTAWSAVFPEPALLNGQNAVTNSISGVEHFFRLSQ